MLYCGINGNIISGLEQVVNHSRSHNTGAKKSDFFHSWINCDGYRLKLFPDYYKDF